VSQNRPSLQFCCGSLHASTRHTKAFLCVPEHIRFYFLFFSVLHFLVVGSVRWIQLTHVGFRAHVKIASRIISYRIVSYRMLYGPAVRGSLSDTATRPPVCLSRPGAQSLSLRHSCPAGHQSCADCESVRARTQIRCDRRGAYRLAAR